MSSKAMSQPRVIQQAVPMKGEHEGDEKEIHELVKDESWVKKEEQDLKDQDLEEEQALKEQLDLEEEDPLHEEEDAQPSLLCFKCRQGLHIFVKYRYHFF